MTVTNHFWDFVIVFVNNGFSGVTFLVLYLTVKASVGPQAFYQNKEGHCIFPLTFFLVYLEVPTLTNWKIPWSVSKNGKLAGTGFIIFQNVSGHFFPCDIHQILIR